MELFRVSPKSILALIIAVLLIASCGSNEPEAESTQESSDAPAIDGPVLQEAVDFDIAVLPGELFLIDTVGVEQGFYERRGLNVELIQAAGGPAFLQLLFSDEVSGYALDTALVLQAHAARPKGDGLALIGMRAPINTYSLIVQGDDWPAEDASFEEKMAALRGKAVGVTQVGAGSDRMLDLALEAAGMDTEDVTHVGAGPPDQGLPQLRAGRLDAYMVVTYASGKFVESQVDGGRYLVQFSAEEVPPHIRRQQTGGIVVRERFAADNPEVVAAWLAAQWDAHEWIVENPDDAARILNETSFAGEHIDLAREVIDWMEQEVYPNMDAGLKVDTQVISDMIETSEQIGMIDPGIIDVDDVVPEFARSAP